MLYRLLLLVLVTLGLTACIGADDYETDIQGEVQVLPEPEPEPDGSILENGGLDSGDTSGWTININTGTGAVADIGVSSDQYFDGSVSLKATITTVGTEPSDIEAGPSGVAVDSTLQYEFSAMVLGTPGAILSFMAVSADDSTMSFGAQSIQLKSSWQKISFTFTVPEGVTSVNLPAQLSYEGNDGAVIYIDAVKLVPGEIPDPDASVIEIEIPNGSFESDNYDPWYFNDGAGSGGVASAAISNAQAHEGINSVEVVVTTPTSNFWEIQLGQSGLDLVEGANHTFSAWVYGTAGASIRVSVQDGVSYADIVSSGTITLVDGWQEVELEFAGVANNELISFSFGYPENVDQTFYVDHVTLFQEVVSTGTPVDIPNASFESSASAYDPWYFVDGSGNGGSATAAISTAQVHDGSNSLEVVVTTPTASSWQIQLGNSGLDLAEGVNHTFSAWVFGSAGAVINAGVQEDGGDYTGAGSSGDVTLSDGWQEITFDFVALAENEAVVFSFGYAANAGQTFYIDHVTIIEEADDGSALLIDFESDTAGTTPYGTTGWDTSVSVSEVVTIASVAGLPANGDSVNVLKVSPPNWNTVPKFSFTLPDGATLADYVVMVDVYLPRETLVDTAPDDDNYYKDFYFLAGAPMTGAATPDNTDLFQSQIGTAGNVDAWTTFTLIPDATKGAALTGEIEIAIGHNRPALSGNDDYYYDNVRLELAP